MARAMTAEHYPCTALCLKRQGVRKEFRKVRPTFYERVFLGKPVSKFTVSQDLTLISQHFVPLLDYISKSYTEKSFQSNTCRIWHLIGHSFFVFVA